MCWFFSMKIEMMDLWMQIEGMKVIFIVNICVLYFITFASRMPQIAQILVSTFKIFRGSMPPDPPRNFLFFFSLAIPGSENLFQEIKVSKYCHLLQFSCIIIINARLINISMIETNSYRIPLGYDLWCRVVRSLLLFWGVGLLFWGVGLLFWGVGLLNFFWGVNRSAVKPYSTNGQYSNNFSQSWNRIYFLFIDWDH